MSLVCSAVLLIVSLLFLAIFRETTIDHMKEPPAPDAAAPLVLCDTSKRVRRKREFETFAPESGQKHQCMGRRFNWLRNMIEVQAALKRVPVEGVDRGGEQSGLCVSAAASRRLKRVASPATSASLSHRAAGGADAVDVPADAIVLAVPSPHWWIADGERREAQGDDASGRGRGRGIQHEKLQQPFPDHSEIIPRRVLQTRLQLQDGKPGVHERFDGCYEVGEIWQPGSFPRLCAHEVDIGTCGAFEACRPSRIVLRQITKVSKIHVQPLVCQIFVFSDVDTLVDEGGQAMFFLVSSAQSASLGRSEELNYIICAVMEEDESIPSPVSLVEPSITGATSPLLMVELETTTTQTPRLTQPHQIMTMTSSPSPVNRQHFCSHQASSCARLPS